MGVASGCCEQKVGVASGSGWNLWVWLLGVVVRRYIDFLILLIPTPLVSVLFTASSLLFVLLKKCFFYYYIIIISWFVLFYTCWLHRLNYPFHLFRAWKTHFWHREESYIRLQAMEIVFSGILPSKFMVLSVLKKMRLLLINFVVQHTHLFQPLVMLKNLSLQDHVQRMRRLKEWGTQVELQGAASFFQKELYVFTQSHSST